MIGIRCYEIKADIDKALAEVKRIIERNKLRFSGAGLKDMRWYFEEDEQKLIIVVDSKNPDRVLDEIELELFEKTGLSRIVSAQVETELGVFDEYKFMIPRLLAFLAYEKILRMLTVKGSLSKLSLSEKIILRLMYSEGELTSKGKAVFEYERLFLNFIGRHKNIIEKIPEGSLSLIAALKEFENYVKREDYVSFILNILGINNINTLVEQNLIDIDFRLTEKSTALSQDFRELVDLVERARLKYSNEGVFREVFNEADSTFKYIVLRSGETTKFSHAKILESLIKAGVDVNVALLALSRASENFVCDKVSSLEVIEVVKDSLNHFDPSWKASCLYDFYLSTRNYIVVENEVLTKRTIRRLAEEYFSDFKPIQSVLDSVVDTVYDALRVLCSTAAPRVIFLKDLYSLNFSEEFLRKVIEEALIKAMPILAILRDSKSVIKYVKNKLKDLRSNLINKARLHETVFDTVSLLLLLFRTVPGPSLTTNLLVLSQKIKASKASTLETLVPLTETDLNRILDLCRKLQKDLSRGVFSEESINIAHRVIESILEKFIESP